MDWRGGRRLEPGARLTLAVGARAAAEAAAGAVHDRLPGSAAGRAALARAGSRAVLLRGVPALLAGRRRRLRRRVAPRSRGRRALLARTPRLGGGRRALLGCIAARALPQGGGWSRGGALIAQGARQWTRCRLRCLLRPSARAAGLAP